MEVPDCTSCHAQDSCMYGVLALQGCLPYRRLKILEVSRALNPISGDSLCMHGSKLISILFETFCGLTSRFLICNHGKCPYSLTAFHVLATPTTA